MDGTLGTDQFNIEFLTGHRPETDFWNMLIFCKKNFNSAAVKRRETVYSLLVKKTFL